METSRREIPTVTIEEFGEKFGLAMKVEERPVPEGSPSRYYASFDRLEIREEGLLRSTHGNGATPEQAIADYARTITLQPLVFDAWGEGRKEIGPHRIVERAEPQPDTIGPFQQTLQIAIASGRGEILLRGSRPDGPEDVAVLIETAAALIDRNASYYRREQRLRVEAGQLLGALRSSIANQLGRTIAVADPRVDVGDDDAIRERAREIAGELLDEDWPLGDAAAAL